MSTSGTNAVSMRPSSDISLPAATGDVSSASIQRANTLTYTPVNQQGTDQTAAASPAAVGTSTLRSTPIRVPSILELYADTLVAFAPVKEGYVNQRNKYVSVGNAYLKGSVCRIVKSFCSRYSSWIISSKSRGDPNSQHGAARGRKLSFIPRKLYTTGVGRLCAVDTGEGVPLVPIWSSSWSFTILQCSSQQRWQKW